MLKSKVIGDKSVMRYMFAAALLVLAQIAANLHPSHSELDSPKDTADCVVCCVISNTPLATPSGPADIPQPALGPAIPVPVKTKSFVAGFRYAVSEARAPPHA